MLKYFILIAALFYIYQQQTSCGGLTCRSDQNCCDHQGIYFCIWKFETCCGWLGCRQNTTCCNKVHCCPAGTECCEKMGCCPRGSKFFI